MEPASLTFLLIFQPDLPLQKNIERKENPLQIGEEIRPDFKPEERRKTAPLIIAIGRFNNLFMISQMIFLRKKFSKMNYTFLSPMTLKQSRKN